MHQRLVIHGDIKDENIVINEYMEAKLIDFGSSRVIPSPTQDRLHRFQGTINYVSPEILVDGSYSGKAFDIWCSGVLLYTMLTGEVPFASVNDVRLLHRRCPRIAMSQDASELIDWMLQKDPTQRPSASQVLAHKWLQC